MRRVGALLWAVALVATAQPALPSVYARAVPSRTSVTVKPGQPASRDVTIQNDGDATVVVHVRLSDWTLNETGDLSLVPPGTTPASLQGFVTFEPAEFSLGPGEAGVIHVTLRLPADGPATRWGVLLSEVRPTVWPRGSLRPRAIAELGTTLYVSRVPEGKTHATLVGMDARQASDSSVFIGVRLQNPGERHLYSAAKIAVRDSAGHTVAETDLGSGVVLPGMERVFTWTCTIPLAPGRYTAVATLDQGEPELLVGETEFLWPAIKPTLASQSGSP